MAKPVKITETVLRDAHQSLIATRMTTEDMLPIVSKLDDIGYHSLEAWGGATFDACLRFLNEDPWERLRKIKDRAKKTPLQMLFRGQNILGYRHCADDVVEYRSEVDSKRYRYPEDIRRIERRKEPRMRHQRLQEGEGSRSGYGVLYDKPRAYDRDLHDYGKAA